jgi:hypothetical protein
MSIEIRKTVLYREDIRHDGGPPLDVPVAKAWAAAVIRNPFAGRYVEDIAPFMDDLKPLGLDLSRRLINALGGDRDRVEAYGKGAIVGADGEIEHGALWHVPGGYAMREMLGQARAIVPSAAKMGGLGTTLDVPLHHINAAYVRSHFDAITVMVADAPRPGEILFAIAMSTGSRPHARLGGLAAADISLWDGQR